MSAHAAARLLAASLGLWLCGCRFDSGGLPLDDAARDAPARSEATALDRQRDKPVAELQARELSCLDGLDNDGDGAIDCADSDCADYECVAAVPPSMSGYYRVHSGAWEDSALPCADGSKAGIYASGAVPASCAACACEALTGAECGYPSIHHWSGGNEDCASGTETDTTPTLGKPGCTIGTGSGTNALKVVAPAALVNAGSCKATGGDLQASKPWSAQLEVCTESAVGGGCPANGVCVRKAAASYEPRICHRLAGGGDCGSWSTVQGHADWKDDRACTACACVPGGTTCSGGSYTFYGDNQSCDSGGCNSPEEIKPDGKCHKFSPGGQSYPYSVSAKKAAASGGSCTATGGAPTGGIKSTLVTFCCR